MNSWDLRTGSIVREIDDHNHSAHGVVLSSDGRRAVSPSWENMLVLWDLKKGRELRRLEVSGYVNCLPGTAGGRRAVSRANNTLKVWDLETGRELHTLAGHFGSVYGGAVSADGCRAVSASSDNTLKVWDLETGSELSTLAGESLYGIGISPDGCRIATLEDKTLNILDSQTGTKIASFTSDAVLYCCTFVSNRIIIAGDQGGGVHLLALHTHPTQAL